VGNRRAYTYTQFHPNLSVDLGPLIAEDGDHPSTESG
jgi:hypothetical protein